MISIMISNIISNMHSIMISMPIDSKIECIFDIEKRGFYGFFRIGKIENFEEKLMFFIYGFKLFWRNKL